MLGSGCSLDCVEDESWLLFIFLGTDCVTVIQSDKIVFALLNIYGRTRYSSAGKIRRIKFRQATILYSGSYLFQNLPEYAVVLPFPSTRILSISQPAVVTRCGYRHSVTIHRSQFHETATAIGFCAPV